MDRPRIFRRNVRLPFFLIWHTSFTVLREGEVGWSRIRDGQRARTFNAVYEWYGSAHAVVY